MLTEEEFAEFYTHSVRRLTGQLYVITGDLHEAEDAVHDAFVRAWNKRRHLDRGHAPEAWVRTVACRLAISRWRRLRRGQQAWAGRLDADSVPGPDPTTVDLTAALRRLPARQRLCAALYYVGDLPVEEIAAETGMATGTVKTHLSRARAALSRHINPADPTDLTDRSTGENRDA
ncbi:SigE family RNA polymerase sigma factor [Streptomyces sp. NPDC093225]|uniref:SigE family RNA polymerase sigma factor n=1 Tax=Streptomyces sp. NPDC093225 TaxID=3366034 RepID=UPI0037F4A057